MARLQVRFFFQLQNSSWSWTSLLFVCVVQVALQAHHCQLRGVFKYKQRYYGCLFSWWCSWQYWSKYSGQNILETVSYHATCPFFYYISYSTQSIYYFISIKWLQNAKIIVVDHNSLWDIIVMGLCYLVKAVKHKYWFHSPYEIKLIFRHCLISYRGLIQFYFISGGCHSGQRSITQRQTSERRPAMETVPLGGHRLKKEKYRYENSYY